MTFYDKRFARDKNFLFLMSDQRRRHELALHTSKLKGGKLMEGFKKMINAEREKCSLCRGTGKCNQDPCTEFSIEMFIFGDCISVSTSPDRII